MFKGAHRRPLTPARIFTNKYGMEIAEGLLHNERAVQAGKPMTATRTGYPPRSLTTGGILSLKRGGSQAAVMSYDLLNLTLIPINQ